MSVNRSRAGSATLVPYMGLDGGLNTNKDPHELLPNELAVSINCWPGFSGGLSKRPGSIGIANATGAVGSGNPGNSLLSCRFNNVTYLLAVDSARSVYAAPAVNGATWVKIGSVSAQSKFVTCAQMFDPDLQVQCVFLADGASVPQYWNGPGTSLQPVTQGGNHLPTKDGTNPITPQYVHTLGNNSHLFYAGEPTQPTDVYISDPFYPQRFTSAAMQINPRAGGYTPAVIGNNDGVEGGDITGLETLGSVMLVFKMAAVYAMVMTTLLGEVPAWQVVQVSNSIGNIAPRSITRFDSFVTFMGIDGMYATDGQSAWKISGDVPTFFDASLSGFQALCTDRTAVRGVRHGNKLLAFFPISGSASTAGLWFNFDKQSAQGNPTVGQISGMNVAGAVALRGPQDDGNFAWYDAGQDRVGHFGIGFQDFGTSFTALFVGKADLFDSTFGPEALVGVKQAQDAYALIQLNAPNPSPVDFVGSVLVDYQQNLSRVIADDILAVTNAGVWGSGKWGSMLWAQGGGAFSFAVVKIPLQTAAKGHVLQVGISETSATPWVVIGYVVYANLQPPSF